MSNYDYTPRSTEGSSKDAGEYLTSSGRTRTLKDAIMQTVRGTKSSGMTVREFSASNVCPSNAHHGQVSGAFSHLHKSGYLSRLEDRRARSEIYVDPQHVNGRKTREHGSVIRARRQEEALQSREYVQEAPAAPVQAQTSVDVVSLQKKAELVSMALDLFPQVHMTSHGRALELGIIELVDEIQQLDH